MYAIFPSFDFATRTVAVFSWFNGSLGLVFKFFFNNDDDCRFPSIEIDKLKEQLNRLKAKNTNNNNIKMHVTNEKNTTISNDQLYQKLTKPMCRMNVN